MRKYLIFIALLLIFALVLSLNLSKGYSPFERLTEDQLVKIGIDPDGNEYTLYDSQISKLVEKLCDMKLGSRVRISDEPEVTIRLYAADDSEYEITVYPEGVSLNGEGYTCDSTYIKELCTLIGNLI